MRAERVEAQLRPFDKLRAHLEQIAPGGSAQTALRCDTLAGGDPGHLIGATTNHDDR
jgi:hypothetical protein